MTTSLQSERDRRRSHGSKNLGELALGASARLRSSRFADRGQQRLEGISDQEVDTFRV